jgi:hypothetical protein
MAKLTWAVLCRRVIIDQGTNGVSYIDAIEGLSAPKFPSPAPVIIAGTLWRRSGPEETTIEVRARAEDSSGKTLQDDEVRLMLEPEHKRGRINIGLGGYDISGPGTYFLVIEQKVGALWVEATRLPFEVELRQPDEEQPGDKIVKRELTVRKRSSGK